MKDAKDKAIVESMMNSSSTTTPNSKSTLSTQPSSTAATSLDLPGQGGEIKPSKSSNSISSKLSERADSIKKADHIHKQDAATSSGANSGRTSVAMAGGNRSSTIIPPPINTAPPVTLPVTNTAATRTANTNNNTSTYTTDNLVTDSQRKRASTAPVKQTPVSGGIPFSIMPSTMMGDVPMPPSEEMDTMLELLMEDLNLTEDKKDVLRILTNDRKWIMLQQHLGERYRDGAARDVSKELEEIAKLKNNPDKELLTNLVVQLRSRPIRWISNFVDNGGLETLLDNLGRIEEENRHDDHEELYIKCLKSLMNNKIGLCAVLDSENSLIIIAQSLRSKSFRTRALVLEIFGAVCLIPGGHRTVLEAMDALAEMAGFRFRFEIVLYCLWEACQGISPLEKDLQVKYRERERKLDLLRDFLAFLKTSIP